MCFRLTGCCASAGIVVVVTGCDWDPEVLPEQLWLGGAPLPIAGAVDPAATNGANGHGNGTNGSNGHSNGNGTNGSGHSANGNGNSTNGNGNGAHRHAANGNGRNGSSGGSTAVHARHAIQAVLGSEFEFVTAADVPRVSMEHCRKFTLQCMHVLVWKFAAAQ